jgi:hypothetical protein
VGDLLSNLAARAVGASSGLRPRVASRFEPRGPRDAARLAEAVIQNRIRFRDEDPEPEGGWIPSDWIAAETSAPTAAPRAADGRALRPSPRELGSVPAPAPSTALEPPRRAPSPVGEASASTAIVAARPRTSGVRPPGAATADSPATPRPTRPTIAPPPDRHHGATASLDSKRERHASPGRSSAGSAQSPGRVVVHPQDARADPGLALTARSSRPAPPSRRDGLRAAPPVQTVVQVTIGRIELRPSAPAARPPGSPARSQPPRPDAVTLDDYLARRSGVAS